jgi:hypothetical protein
VAEAAGGAPKYLQKCEEVVAHGYEGFACRESPTALMAINNASARSAAATGSNRIADAISKKPVRELGNRPRGRCDNNRADKSIAQRGARTGTNTARRAYFDTIA